MNILQQLDIQPDQTKPAVLSLRKSEKLAVLAIGLAAGQVMPEHQTKTDASLVVLQGKVQFRTAAGQQLLHPGDHHDTPAGVPHDVLAEETSAFLLIRES